MGEYTPVGRPSSFTVCDLEDSADLITILSNLANDCVNASGDTMSGNFTITGILDASTLRKGGVAVSTVSATEELTNKTLAAGNSIKAGATLTNAGTISGGTVSGATLLNPTLSGTITGLPAADWVISNKTVSYVVQATDDNKLLTMTSASTTTFTLPSDAAEPTMGIGATITGARMGAGALAFAQGAGATVVGTPGLNFRAQYSIAAAIKVAANTWLVSGDVIA